MRHGTWQDQKAAKAAAQKKASMDVMNNRRQTEGARQKANAKGKGKGTTKKPRKQRRPKRQSKYFF
jgi:hypothetical protein